MKKKKNLKLIYSGHVLSCTALNSGMPLKQRKQLFQINVTELNILTSRRQTIWLFTWRDRELELGATEKQTR